MTCKDDQFGEGWFCAHNQLEDGQEINFSVSRGVADINPEVEVKVEGNVRWFRLLRKIEFPASSIGRARAAISYAAESSKQGLDSDIGVVGIYGRDKTGYFGPISKLTEPIAVSDTKVFAQGVLELSEIPEQYHEMYLVVELRHPCDVKLFDLELSVPENEEDFFHSQVADVPDVIGNGDQDRVVVPYRIANFSSSDLLAGLNDNIDRDLRRKPLSWISGMLTVALRNEDYETAASLVEHAVALNQTAREPLDPLVDAACKVLVATGDQARLERFSVLIARSGLNGRSRDRAIVKLRLALGEVGEDLFSVNEQIGQNSPDLALGDVLTALTGKLNDHLLLANFYRTRDGQRQSEEINAYLSEFDLPFEIDLGDDEANVLANLQAREKAEVLSVQDSSGTEAIEAQYQPLVSVITAAYNCEKTIEYAVRSLLGQSYPNIELLIADDCSDDGTLEKLKEYKKLPNVRVFKSAKNQGPYNIRNALIEEAKGELITFHDSDDFALPHRIESQVSTMIKAGTVVSVGRWIRIMPNGHFVTFPDGNFLRMCVNSIMFHRKVFDAFGPYRSVLFGADSEFYEKARGHLRPNQVSQVEVPGVLGLWSSSSLTKTPGIEASERGYRAPKRRLYAGLAGRQRMLGDQIVSDDMVEEVLKDADIYREPQSIEELN
ncbi:glycosyltransferase family 2 protein [Phaeobacter sp. CAU 1743]|uniref:glycosyltransferase family 2 protein n=1 Tax=Phaeobacter sp. CAU 1743 TaxID=3140367 RepID=UPI00325BFA21